MEPNEVIIIDFQYKSEQKRIIIFFPENVCYRKMNCSTSFFIIYHFLMVPNFKMRKFFILNQHEARLNINIFLRSVFLIQDKRGTRRFSEFY